MSAAHSNEQAECSTMLAVLRWGRAHGERVKSGVVFKHCRGRPGSVVFLDRLGVIRARDKLKPLKQFFFYLISVDGYFWGIWAQAR